jgi:replicative DNA helicase
MKDLGILGNKNIPTIYKINDESVLLNVIAGLIDSDGTYCETKRFFEITQKYDKKHIIDDIKFMCDSLGFKTSVTTRIAGKKSKNPDTLHYRLRISGNIEKIPTKIARKRAKAPFGNKIRRNWNEYTFKVEEYGKDTYYGFTVDGNHLFVLKDFSIVHNSFPNLIGLYGTLRPSMEDGDVVFGQIYC